MEPTQTQCSRLVRILTLTLLLACSASIGALAGTESPEARLLRFPDIHQDFVVFVYAGDVWRAPSGGGDARRLTSHEGQELFPKISRDGRWVAFSAEYSGSRQVYVVPAAGGKPKQLTFYADVGEMPPRGGSDYWIQGWTPDGKILVRMNRTPYGRRRGRYFLVDPAGGLETPLALPEGGGASLSPDGKSLAYCPVDREFRTWKRTRGGRAQDVWLYDLEANRSQRITDDPGTDNFPMWAGETIYFTSDREHTLNLFAYDLRERSLRKVTHFDAYDVLWPSLGDDAIVFMNGGYLYRLDLTGEETAKIPIRIGSDLPSTVPHFRNVGPNIGGATLSPSGARAVFDARGELFSVPAQEGPTRNLTRTQGIREMDPAWSPDGRWIAYLSDAGGEYELTLRAQDGSGEPRRLTTDGGVWRFPPVWSPDSAKIAFSDQLRRLRFVEVETGKLTDVDTGKQADILNYGWSPDSRWLAYGTSHDTRLPGLAVYSLDTGKVMVLGDGLTFDFEPVWSSDGKTLFFLSNRDYQLRQSVFEFNYIYDRATRVYAASLDPEAPPLFPLKSDEEEGNEESAAESGEDGDKDEDPGEAKRGKAKQRGQAGEGPRSSLRVEPESFVARTLAVPGIEPHNYLGLSVTAQALFYLRATDDDGGDFTLLRYDLAARREETVLDGVQDYLLSADGKKLLYRSGTNWGIAEARADLKPGDGRLELSGLMVKLDPKAEWRQIFDDAWRITRDWFYDPNMHGLDWDAMRERYGALVPHVAHRAEMDFILGELIGELEAGHTYVASGDHPRVERVRGGMLGCEFELDASGFYRIARIFAGENWDEAFRSPLTEPGVNVREGQFLLAVDGVPLRHPENPYRLLENKADRQVVLTVSDRPAPDGGREVTVRPVASELNLFYLDWVKSRMAMTDRLSDGRIGYIHLPNTALEGNRMLQKLFYAQVDKEALIIDDRYNGGGFIPDRMIEYFSRTTLAYWARRDLAGMRTPGFAHDGPKAMLINAQAASGGDALPYFFKLRGLGPLIGTRTWGGLIGLTGGPQLVDGGAVQVPTFRIYDTEGSWTVENEGVAPDIEVIDLPEALIAGGDPSLEKAVEVLLEELGKHPKTRPEVPQPPDMTQ
ncbi:MAG: acetyl-CoA synthetase [bacterium]|nr:acetyl-CoA synthetase [bacterium]